MQALNLIEIFKEFNIDFINNITLFGQNLNLITDVYHYISFLTAKDFYHLIVQLEETLNGRFEYLNSDNHKITRVVYIF